MLQLYVYTFFFSPEDMSHAVCMRNILQAVDHDDLRKLLEKSKDEAESVSASVDEEVQGTVDGIRAVIIKL